MLVLANSYLVFVFYFCFCFVSNKRLFSATFDSLDNIEFLKHYCMNVSIVLSCYISIDDIATA